MIDVSFTAEQAHAAVARGAAWLDTQCPDWIGEINLDRLDLESPTFCMLGQTARCLIGEKPNGSAVRDGYYKVMRERFGFSTTQWAWSGEHGFSLLIGNGRFPSRRERRAGWEMLEIAWKELVRDRLEAQVAQS